MPELKNNGITIRPLARAFVLGVLLLVSSSDAASRFDLPEGFQIENVVPPGAVRFPMFAAFDEAARLYLAESSGLDLYEELQKLTRKCRVSVLEDTNADGKFDDARVFAEGLVFPMGLAWKEGKLYVADPPDLVTLEDTDGDGQADKRTVILTGFGHTDNGSLHGLVFGPDGWLYMTMGQPDGFRITRTDGKVIEGKSGALLRCKPDGTHLEVVSRGFENLVEVVFLPTGEIIGTDNWFYLPEDGVRDALVHLLPGGVYPLNAHAAFERASFFSGELLPPLQVYPAVAHSGLMRYAGRSFPTEMQGSLFSAQFNTRKIVRHQLSRHGSTFQSADYDFLTTTDPDFHPSDVLEAPDGSLLVIDTGSWYVHHCPTGRIRHAPAEGGIYRVRYTNALSTARIDPSTNRADALAARARTMGWERDRKHAPELSRLVLHQAAHVRLAAAEALATCGSSESLPAIVESLTRTNDAFLSHALSYALHRVADVVTLDRLLDHPHPQVQRAALILLDQAPHQKLPAVAAFDRAKSSDAQLRAAAITAIKRHPEWKEGALSLITNLFASERASDADALNELVPVFLGLPQVRQLLAETISNQAKPTALRVSMLGMLSQATDPTGNSVPPAILSALRSPEPELLTAALRSLRPQQIRSSAQEFATIARSRHSLPLRLEAARLLVRGETVPNDIFALLESAFATNNSPALRLSAAEALATSKLSGKQLQNFISSAQADRLISPMLVLPAAERSQERESASDSLLNYLRDSVEAGWQMPEPTLQWLRATFPERQQVQELATAARQRAEAQMAELQRIEPLLRGGDPNNGHQLFLGKLACATCHRVGKHGGLAGPDLTRLGAIRSGRDIIESLIVPSATLAQGYETYQVTLIEGESLTGVRVRQPDDSFVMRDSSGAETRIEPAQIAKVERLQTSLMPDGLISNLAEQEIRDLLGYLQSLK